MSDNSPPLELWLQEIQSYLHKVIYGPLNMAGFDFDKYNYSFTRKHGKHIQEFGFLFVNQFPVNYRINFMLQIRNKSVREIKSSLLNIRDKGSPRLSSLVVLMADFMKEKNMLSNSGDYIIRTNKDLFSASSIVNIILQDQAMPLCDSLETLNDLDLFFSNPPDWYINNRRTDNAISELIVAKLNGRRNYHEVLQQLMSRATAKAENDQTDKSVKILESCDRLLQKM